MRTLLNVELRQRPIHFTFHAAMSEMELVQDLISARLYDRKRNRFDQTARPHWAIDAICLSLNVIPLMDFSASEPKGTTAWSIS